jgi:hypothetical protein
MCQVNWSSQRSTSLWTRNCPLSKGCLPTSRDLSTHTPTKSSNVETLRMNGPPPPLLSYTRSVSCSNAQPRKLLDLANNLLYAHWDMWHPLRAPLSQFSPWTKSRTPKSSVTQSGILRNGSEPQTNHATRASTPGNHAARMTATKGTQGRRVDDRPTPGTRDQTDHVDARHHDRANALARPAQVGVAIAAGTTIDTREKDQREGRLTSGRTPSPVSTRLGTTLRLRMGKLRHQRRLQDTIRVRPANPLTPAQEIPNVRSGEIGHRKGGTVTVAQESYRGGYRPRFLQPTVHRAQKDRRPTPSAQFTPTQPPHTTAVFQNGNSPPDLPPNTERRLHDIHRLERRIPSRVIPPHIQEVPEVRMAREGVPIQDATVRVVPVPTGVHQDTQARPSLGPSKGITIFAYLDDILIIGLSQERTKQYTQMVLKKLHELGFLVKESKSTLVPTQTIDHLGFTIDTNKMTLSVPKAKTRDLRREASKLFAKPTAPLRTIAAFIGKAMAMTMAVFPARMMTRQLRQLSNQALRTRCKWTDQITINPQAQEELRWWKSHLSQWNGQSFLPQATDVDVYTDSSDNHWGIVINESTLKGSWSPQEANQHINWKELQCVWIAVNLPQCIGRTVNVISDNNTAISYINKFGGTRSEQLLSLASKIWQHCLRTGTRLKTTFVPSLFNPADAPSRQMTQQLEWSISQDFFRSLDQQWGPHHMDLFASHLNNKVPRYVSWKSHPTAYKTDALQHRWLSWGRLWICPPWNLIPRVLHQIQEEQLQATLVTPNWEGAMWFPTVQSMAVAPPVPIPRDQVLAGPGYSDHVLDRNRTWALTAWNIDGSLLRTRAPARM